MTRQGGVAGLLSRRHGTGDGGEMESVVAFNDGDDAPVIGSDSGDVLQQGEATGRVRGKLNRSGRLLRRRSPSRGGDGDGGSKSGGAGGSPVA
jgi:hypothetical protein